MLVANPIKQMPGDDYGRPMNQKKDLAINMWNQTFENGGVGKMNTLYHNGENQSQQWGLKLEKTESRWLNCSFHKCVAD